MRVMFKSTSTSLILLGVLGVIVGIIAIAWPNVTIAALVIVFAIFAFIAAGLSAMRAFSSDKAGPVFGYLLLALIDLAAGVAALVWPKPTALVLVLVVAIWAFVAGFAELFAAFQSGETAGTRAMFIVTGLISIAFGVVLSARPDIGAVTLALLFGLYSLIYGVAEIVVGVQMRRTAAGRTKEESAAPRRRGTKMAKPDPGTQSPAGPPAQPPNERRFELPIKLQHHPVVLEEQARRASDLQLRIADRITAFAGSMNFVYIHIAIFTIWMLFIESKPWPTLTLI